MKEFNIIGLRVCEYQGKLFEASTKKLKCSSKIFLRRFIHSELLTFLDKNDDIFIPYTIDEALDDIEKEFGKTEYGSVKFNPENMYWMGYMYRYMSFTRETNTNLLFKWFPPEQLNNVFYSFHTQDPEWCIRSLLEMNNLEENIFNPNWRLLQAIRTFYKNKSVSN